ncbi:MAG: hypothetical protein ACK4ME_12185, partial [Fimbriimonadales bacterium]
ACLPSSHDAHTEGAYVEGAHTGAKGAHAGAPLQEIVQWFKTMTTNAYIHGVKQYRWRPFNRRLWQRNYYEHIIRNEEDWDAIQHYILTNPLYWQSDRENPIMEAVHS